MTAVVCLGLYAVIVACYLVGNHRWHEMERRGRKIHGDYPGCVQVPWPMKRPPITQADVDSTWLSIWPDEVDEADLLNRQFVSLISAEWDWPDAEDVA
jgi:hypothetical protein